MASIEIEIGGIKFKSKKAAEAAILKFIHSLPLYRPLSGEAEMLMYDIFDNHPNRHTKRRQNVKYFSIVTGNDMLKIEGTRPWSAPDPKYRAICITYDDGSMGGIAWRKALYGVSTPRRAMTIAARRPIDDTVSAFREAHNRGDGTVLCEECRGKFRAHETDVHHETEWTFCALLTLWVLAETAAFGEPVVLQYGAQSRFEDETVAARWKHVHDWNCKLKLVCSKCHYDAHHPS